MFEYAPVNSCELGWGRTFTVREKVYQEDFWGVRNSRMSKNQLARYKTEALDEYGVCEIVLRAWNVVSAGKQDVGTTWPGLI